MRLTSIRRALAVIAAVVALSGCTDEPAGVDPDLGGAEVTVQSGEDVVRVQPLCVGDIPDDYTACPDAPQNLGELVLDPSLVATVSVPVEVANGGWRLRLDGEPVPGVDQPLDDPVQPVTVPQEAVAAPEEAVLTVEALSDRDAPRAVWEVLLADPEAG